MENIPKNGTGDYFAQNPAGSLVSDQNKKPIG
jgi:hypothetical protein